MRNSNKHKEKKQKGREKDDPHEDPLLTCCCCLPFVYAIRGLGRCLFVACYPMLSCCGLDEHRHQHSDPKFRNFR
ncbi:hypothetical protein LUZ60_003912 [Juncus effusus]|nr:hypothetical protein LUZ60_003912 [Juncus effusus]